MRQVAFVALIFISFINMMIFKPNVQNFSSGEVLFNSITSDRNIQTVIMRYNPATGSITTFSDLVYAGVIGVSPNNRTVAVHRVNPQSGEQQLCFLNREGVVQICTANDVATYADSITSRPFVTWSDDSLYFYYVNYILEQQTTVRRLVEIEVATAQMKRFVVSLQADFGFVHDFTWKPDLSSIAILWSQTAYDHVGGAKLYKISNGQAQLDRTLTQILSSKTRIDASGQSEKLTHYLVPCRFSPKGNFLAFVDRQFPMNIEPPLNFAVQDHIGNLIYQTSNSNMPRWCPTWQEDESAFYYTSIVEKQNSHIGELKREYTLYKVTIPSGKIDVILAEPEKLAFSKFIEPRLYPGPDGKYIAFEGSYNADAEGIKGVGVIASMIGIIDASGNVSYIKGPCNNAYNPFWLPSQSK